MRLLPREERSAVRDARQARRDDVREPLGRRRGVRALSHARRGPREARAAMPRVSAQGGGGARPHYALDANVGNLEGDAEAAREEAASLAADARARRPRRARASRVRRARVRDACERAGVDAATHREDARARGPLAPACARALRAQELASARAARGGVGAPPFERRHAEQHAAIVSRMIAADLVRDEDASEDPALEDDDDDEKHQEKGPNEIAKAAAESSNVARASTSPFLEAAAGVRRARRGARVPLPLPPRRVRPRGCRPRRARDVQTQSRAKHRRRAAKETASRVAAIEKNVLPLPEETVEEETAEAEEDARLVRSAIARRERSRVSRLRVDIKDLRLAGAARRRGAASSRRGNTCAAPPPTSR